MSAREPEGDINMKNRLVAVIIVCFLVVSGLYIFFSYNQVSCPYGNLVAVKINDLEYRLIVHDPKETPPIEERHGNITFRCSLHDNTSSDDETVYSFRLRQGLLFSDDNISVSFIDAGSDGKVSDNDYFNMILFTEYYLEYKIYILVLSDGKWVCGGGFTPAYSSSDSTVPPQSAS